MRALVLLLSCILPIFAFGTAQHPEVLLFEGKKESMFAEPLEKYFSESRPKPEMFEPTSTACWRGYIGTWKIQDGSLLLISLGRERMKKMDGEWRIVMDNVPLTKVFPDARGPVHAEWFSGVIRVPRGKMLRYVHMGFGSLTEQNLYLTFKTGRLTAKRLVDNKEFGATRSDSDMQWVALAEQPVPDPGDWIDARTIGTEQPKGAFKTRGIFAAEESNPATLWVPDTPTTESVSYVLEALPNEPAIAAGAHIEINAERDSNTQNDHLRVKAVRALEPGESIHHKHFKKPEQNSR